MPANQMQEAFIRAVRQSDSLANCLENQRCWIDVELNGAKFHLRIKNDKVEKVTPHGHRGSWFQRIRGQAVEQRLLKAVKGFHVSEIISTGIAVQANRECLIKEYSVNNLRDMQSPEYCVDKLNDILCSSRRYRELPPSEAAPKSMNSKYDDELRISPGLHSLIETLPHPITAKYDAELLPSTETLPNPITTKYDAKLHFTPAIPVNSTITELDDESHSFTETLPNPITTKYDAKLHFPPATPPNSTITEPDDESHFTPATPANSKITVFDDKSHSSTETLSNLIITKYDYELHSPIFTPTNSIVKEYYDEYYDEIECELNSSVSQNW